MASVPNGAAAFKALMGDLGKQFKVVNGMGAKQTVDKTAEFAQALKDLVKRRVLVGIPAANAKRDGSATGVDDGGMNNPSRLYIHEFGDASAHIPARPTVFPGIRDAQGRITKYFMAAGKAALKGDQNGAVQALHSAGATARDAIKLRINSDTPPPLSANYTKRLAAAAVAKVESKYKTKKISQARADKIFKAAGQHFPTLLRTKQMRNAITYVVETK